MLTRLLTALSLMVLPALFKRLFIRKPPTPPYRKAESNWPSSYRKPS